MTKRANSEETLQLHRWCMRLRSGDKAALTDLIAYYQSRLTHLTRRMLRDYPGVRNWEQTDDVLSAALVRLDRALRKLSPNSTEHFLKLAALQIRRELLDLAGHYRHRVRHFSLSPGGSGADMHAADVSEPTAQPCRLEAWTEFHHKIAALPEKSQTLFHLLWYQGASQADAATLLGVSERTIRTRWQAARLELRAMYGEDLPDL